MTPTESWDVLVVGGGINGAGIARDAAGRGLSVALCEQGDLGQFTSSASTKLIHGGLRYLEHYEFGLVRKALREREVLLGIAPHIIWPMRFVMPHVRELRPAWMIRAGLFLYDHLGGRRRLPGSGAIRLREHAAGAPLDERLDRGFVYSDCWVQDSRLVVLNALDAAERGASIQPRTRCVAAERGRDAWHVTLRSTVNGSERVVSARTLVNAAGPWVSRFVDEAVHDSGEPVTLVKGSHIVVPRRSDHGYAYLFQHTDGRVIFAIPYERDYTLIGTTDVVYEGDPSEAAASEEEIRYLCDAVNRYFVETVRPADVIWTYAGVRTLHAAGSSDNASSLSRDYALQMDRRGAPLLNVLGGKLTTYRKLAHEACVELAEVLGCDDAGWTGSEALPGGDIDDADFDRFLADVRRRWPWLPADMAWRLARNYGTRIERILGQARALADLGEHFGDDLYEAELRYLVAAEWATTAADVVWRRSKLGLALDAEAVARMERWLHGHTAPGEWGATGT
jgi:glycerol-3-phosphate dehydrogenase